MKTTLRAALAAVALAASSLASAPTSLLSVSYDVSRRVFQGRQRRLRRQLQRRPRAGHQVDQSHAGSSAQARARSPTVSTPTW